MAKRGKTQESVRLSAESLLDELTYHRGPIAQLVACAETMTPLQLDMLLAVARLIPRRFPDEKARKA